MSQKRDKKLRRIARKQSGQIARKTIDEILKLDFRKRLKIALKIIKGRSF